jgi:serine/threonine protein kinase
MIISQVGQALQYAHQQNIVHCNLKPQNILFNAQGQVLLTDFHLTSLPESLHISASTTYMAPEELLGAISKECDQYALGCIAYEMLTGHTPYHASSLYYPGIHRRLPTLVPPTQLNPLLPSHIERAVLKALAPEPDQRHSDIQAFLTALGVSAEYSHLESATAAPVEEMASYAAASALPLEGVNYQRNNPSRPKTYLIKHKKILIALSCILLFACAISALYVLVFAQPKLRIQPTPTTIKMNRSIMTTTPIVIVTPSIATSPTPTLINQPVIIQPLPTRSAITQPSSTSIPIPTATFTALPDTITSPPAQRISADHYYGP